MTKFRPCIDLHEGKVKQIVGSTLVDSTDRATTQATENHVAQQPAEWFAKTYADHQLLGGHLIKLGPGNDDAARSALAAYPDGLQIGGGITAINATDWLDAGASHVIVTSWLFDDAGEFVPDRLEQMVNLVGKHRIVIDLSCKRTSQGWTVAMNRWQTLTNLQVTHETLNRLADRCDEFLIHAADVEGLCQGIDHELVELLGRWNGLPMTYAGGVANLEDVRAIDRISQGKVDVTVGSALDLFGGTGVRFEDLIAFNRQ